MIVCNSCGNTFLFNDLKLIREEPPLSSYESYLHKNHIYFICKGCYSTGQELFNTDIELFDEWVKIHCNIKKDSGIDEIYTILRKDYDLTSKILKEDFEEYYKSLDRYTSDLESFILWMCKKNKLDLRSSFNSFKNFKSRGNGW